jgi:diguanylate cyclase (GGDEF)-like protein
VIYSAIFQLTEARDIDSVNQAFLNVLSTVIKGDFVLYVVQGLGADSQFVLSSHENPFGEEVKDILSVFHPAHHAMSVHLPKHLRPFPLVSANGLHALLIVGDEAVIHDEDFLNCLISVYCNHFSLVERSSCDALTGLHNRGVFDKKLYQLLESQGKQQRLLDVSSENDEVKDCLALLDIDFFKSINDRFGHLYGDEVLLLLAQQLQKVFRDDDLLFRYGGEEFAIILRGLTQTQAQHVLERARSSIEAFSFPQVGQVTVSLGYSMVSAVMSASCLISEADAALYYAKAHGRNQAQCYQALLDKGELAENSKLTGDIDLF